MTSDPLDKGRCPLHNVPLKEGEAVVRYGFIRFSERYLAARDRLFPHAHFFVFGGERCDHMDQRYVSPVLYCELCRKAEMIWQQVESEE